MTWFPPAAFDQKGFNCPALLVLSEQPSPASSVRRAAAAEWPSPSPAAFLWKYEHNDDHKLIYHILHHEISKWCSARHKIVTVNISACGSGIGRTEHALWCFDDNVEGLKRGIQMHIIFCNIYRVYIVIFKIHNCKKKTILFKLMYCVLALK